MASCPACGEANPDHARFCLKCGTALTQAGPRGEERKLVSVLFVDLVGFTSRSDRADPEDVRDTLQLYHSRVKEQIERYGGTVEKFIGDADRLGSPPGRWKSRAALGRALYALGGTTRKSEHSVRPPT